jgi:hypothetical protein
MGIGGWGNFPLASHQFLVASPQSPGNILLPSYILVDGDSLPRSVEYSCSVYELLMSSLGEKQKSQTTLKDKEKLQELAKIL